MAMILAGADNPTPVLVIGADHDMIRAGSAAFTPAALAPTLWLAADVGTYQDAARTTPAVADGAPVGGWADQSGNGLHAAQATAGSRPTLQLSEVNGKPVLRFDGVDDVLSIADNALLDVGTGAFSLFVVAKYISGTDPRVLVKGTSTGADNGLFIYYDTTFTNGWVYYTPAFQPPYVATGTGWELLSTLRAGTGADQLTLYRSGVLTATSLDARTLSNAHPLTMGATADSVGFANVDIAEIIFIPRLVSTAEQDQVEAYLGAKYGIGLTVPAILHPTLWLAADSGVYQDAARTIPAVADGDPVGGWADQSGNGYHGYEPKGDGARPTLQTNELNGLPVLRFDGVDDLLATTPVFAAALTTSTILLVAKATAGVTQMFYDGLVNTNRNTLYNAGTPNSIGQYAGLEVYGPVGYTAAYDVWTSQFSGASSFTRKNGVVHSSGDVGSQSLTGLNLGGQYGVGLNPLLGDIAEIIVIPRALSASEIDEAEAYLAAKYGVTL